MSSRSAGTNIFTLASGEVTEINANAQFVRVIEATAGFEFNIDDGGWQYFAKGMSYHSDAIDGFNLIRIRNISALPNVIRIGYGWGTLTDDRLNIVDEILNVREVEQRRLTDDGGSISTVGASYYGGQPAGGGGTELVSAAANINGVIIRTCLVVRGGAGSVQVRVDGWTVFYGYGAVAFAENLTREIYIPAGKAISAVGDGVTSLIVTYDFQ